MLQHEFGGGVSGGRGKVVEVIGGHIARLEEVNILEKTVKQQNYPRPGGRGQLARSLVLFSIWTSSS